MLQFIAVSSLIVISFPLMSSVLSLVYIPGEFPTVLCDYAAFFRARHLRFTCSCPRLLEESHISEYGSSQLLAVLVYTFQSFCCYWPV